MKNRIWLILALPLLGISLNSSASLAQEESQPRNFSAQVAGSVDALNFFAEAGDTDSLKVIQAYKWANTARKPLGDRLCLLVLHHDRPVASCKIYLNFKNLVFTPISMTDLSLICVHDGQTVWAPPPSPTEFKRLESVRAPSDSASRRRVEMKAIARQFSGNTGAGEAERQKSTPEIRLLPTPLHQYSSSQLLKKHRIVEGAVFGFVLEGGNPQVLMMLEAVADQDGKPAYWQVGFSRRTFAELHVNHNEQEIWTAPYLRGAEMTSNSYFHKITLPMPVMAEVEELSAQ